MLFIIFEEYSSGVLDVVTIESENRNRNRILFRFEKGNVYSKYLSQ